MHGAARVKDIQKTAGSMFRKHYKLTLQQNVGSVILEGHSKKNSTHYSAESVTSFQIFIFMQAFMRNTDN